MFTCTLTITPPNYNSTKPFKAGQCKIDAYSLCARVCTSDSLLFALLAYFWRKLHSDNIDSACPRPCQIIQFRSHYLRENTGTLFTVWHKHTHAQINTDTHFYGANTNTVMYTQCMRNHRKGLFYLFMLMIYIWQWRMWPWLHNTWACRRSDAWRHERVKRFKQVGQRE